MQFSKDKDDQGRQKYHQNQIKTGITNQIPTRFLQNMYLRLQIMMISKMDLVSR